jgi:hypothetical protein
MYKTSDVREALHKKPPGRGVVQLLRDEPRFSFLPPHVLRVMAWAYRYAEDLVPARDDIRRGDA